LSVAHDRITQLSTEIVTANNAAAHSSEQLLKFEAMYETLAKQKVDLQAEVASLEGALLQRKEALTAAQSQLQHEQSTFEALRKRHDISLSQLAAAAAERENLIRGIKKLQTLLEEAKHEEERLTTEIDGLNLKASHLQEQALDAQKEFKATIKELEENISRLDKAKVKSDKVVENIENERDLMQMDLIRIQKDNEELRQQAAQASATYKMSLGTLTTALEQERKRFDEERGNVAKVQNAGREKLKHVYDRHDQLTQQLQQRYEQLVRRLSHPHRLRITCRIVPHSLIGERINQSGDGDGVG
jgi:chromosome segregation ATPase